MREAVPLHTWDDMTHHDRPRALERRATPTSSHDAEPRDAILIEGVGKRYASGHVALDGVDLAIRRGEIFALLGANGAGKSTLIGIVCGLVNPSAGRVLVEGHDVVRDYRAARAHVGLVPQELHVDSFETVWNTVSFSRGLFGKPHEPARLEAILRDLALWEKRDAQIRSLSGGMKRRVLIAKALAHDPTILFLDEPSAGVDVELRRDMWEMVRRLREAGTTVILTTHYIEEAEEMADRIGVIHKGRLLVVDGKDALMRRLGRKRLALHLRRPLAALPAPLAGHPGLSLENEGAELAYVFDGQAEETGIPELIRLLQENGIEFKDLATSESSLEEIFVDLVREDAR